jgi:hypothetical protein
MSGNGGSARLKSNANRVQLDELGAGGQVYKFVRLRKQQQRRRRKQHGIRQGDNGANRTGVTGLLIRIVIGDRLPSGLIDRVRRGKTIGVGRYGPRRAGLNRRSRLRDSVEMSECKNQLYRQRKKRQPRAVFDIRSEPLHADLRLHHVPASLSRSCGVRGITSEMNEGCQRHCPAVQPERGGPKAFQLFRILKL